MPQFRGYRCPGLGNVNAFSAVLAGGLRRHDIRRLGSGFLDHNGQTARIVQHWAGAQQILIERLIDTILLEQRIFIGLQQRIRADVGVGIVHEGAGLNIAARVDMDIALAASNASADVFAVIPEIHGEQRLGFSEVPDLVVHILALIGGGHQLRHRVLSDGHIGEEPAKFCAPVDHGVDIFLAADELRMDKACDTLPGMKHRCTAAALRYLRAEVMEMCQREGLYQIDLLNGRKDRITEREYWAQKQGQKKLDEENAERIANGEEPKQTKFETDKQILRQQIRAVMKKSKTLDEFFDTLLEDYGVAVKESRGRFSYLTPERTKPITSRKLGDDFSKEAILAVLEQNAARVLPSVSQRPDNSVTPAMKPEIEKLIDLEAKRAEGKGAGYIHWGKTFNLKTMAKTLIYLQENGLTDLVALDAALAEAHEKVKIGRAEIKAIEQTLKEKKELQRQVLNAHAGKDLHAEYLKLPKKKQEKFYEKNRPALISVPKRSTPRRPPWAATSLPPPPVSLAAAPKG